MLVPGDRRRRIPWPASASSRLTSGRRSTAPSAAAARRVKAEESLVNTRCSPSIAAIVSKLCALASPLVAPQNERVTRVGEPRAVQMRRQGVGQDGGIEQPQINSLPRQGMNLVRRIADQGEARASVAMGMTRCQRESQPAGRRPKGAENATRCGGQAGTEFVIGKRCELPGFSLRSRTRRVNKRPSASGNRATGPPCVKHCHAVRSWGRSLLMWADQRRAGRTHGP